MNGALILLALTLALLSGCTEYKCVDGVAHYRSKVGDGLWHVATLNPNCVNLPDENK